MTVARPQVVYCGFTDTANIGDYALFQTNRALFQRLDVVPPGAGASATVNLFGGGTHLPYSLRYGRYARRPVNVAIGVGVEDPAFVGRFGPATVLALHWWRFRRLGVRGFRSQRILRAYGLSSVVTGDTALALEDPGEPGRSNAVGISLVGESMQRDGSREAVSEAVRRYCHRLLAEGLEVVLVPFCDTDLPAARTLQDSLDGNVELIDFWRPPVSHSLTALLARLASLRFMVAERLHAAVLAAVAGTPTAVLPYKPKCLDFADTLPEEAVTVVGYDGLSEGELWRLTRAALADWPSRHERLVEHVRGHRETLRRFAAEIEATVLGRAGAR